MSTTIKKTFQVTENIELRFFENEDAEELFNLIDSSRDDLRQWLGWVDDVKKIADTAEFIRIMTKAHEESRSIVRGAYFKNQLVGVIGFNILDWTNKKAEFGYWLAPPARGNGIVTKCCAHLISYLFNVLEFNKIQLTAASENDASNAVATRLGMKHEGVLRENEWLYDHFVDHNCYSILESEYREQHKP